MLRGIFAASTGMIAQSEKIDILGNNVANANTSGFKKDDVSFKEFNDQYITNINNGNYVGSDSFGVMDNKVSTEVRQGANKSKY
jgi:flagellar basal-body rod protein FlgF